MITYQIFDGISDVDVLYRMFDFETNTLSAETAMLGGSNIVSPTDIAVLSNGNIVVASDTEADQVIDSGFSSRAA